LWKSATLPFLGGVPRRIGFSSATIREFGVPLLYTERVETSKAHIAEQNGDLSLHAGAQRRTAPVNLQIQTGTKFLFARSCGVRGSNAMLY